ncbi:exosortase A [Aestuariirhabdus sp. LZHN29]|uniref:exosortase A n=1 Tax=Aestuariirhabdus sp. LZHN29 TaxID=3417462 RepID=UPI003CF3E17D
MLGFGRHPWASAVSIYGSGLIVIAVGYMETIAEMVSIWNRSGTFNHCFIILPISLFLIYRKKSQLRALSPRPSAIGFSILALLVLVWTISSIVEVQVLQQFSVVMMLSALCLAVMGWAVVKTILFPLGYTLFMVPFGEFLIEPMMNLTASFTVTTIAALGIPIFVEGLFFELPTGRWSVVEGCSGVRYLIASVALGTLYAYLNYHSYKKRVTFVLASIALPIVGNWLRASGIVMLGHFSGMRLAVGVDHLLYGWVFFGILMLLLFAVGSRWRDSEEEVFIGQVGGSNYPLVSGLAVPIMLLAIVTWSGSSTERDAFSGRIDLRANYQGAVLDVDTRHPPFEPNFQRADAVASFSVKTQLLTGQLLAYWYGYSPDSLKLVTSTNRVVAQKDPRWRSIPTAEKGDSCPLNNLSIVESNTERYYVVSWYLIDGAPVCNPVTAKLKQLLSRLGGAKEQGGHVVLVMDASKVEIDLQALADLVSGLTLDGVMYAN